MRNALAAALICTLWITADSHAQSADASVQAIAAAVHGIVGSVPIEHPGGATRSVCIEADRLGGTTPISDEVMNRVRSAVAQAGVLRLTDGCHRIDAPTYGGWVVDAGGAPAVNIRVRSAQFAAGRAEIMIQEQRGGRLGHSARCTITQDGSDRWSLDNCTTTSMS